MLSYLNELISGKSYYILNFDGMHNNRENKSGAGIIIRDNQGEFKLSVSCSFPQKFANICNVPMASAMALLLGLEYAKREKIKINIIKGDNREIIDYVLNPNVRSQNNQILNEIMNHINGMIDRTAQTIELIDREANQVAKCLAVFGVLGVHKFCTTIDDLPPQVAKLVTREKGKGSSMALKLFTAAIVIGGAAILAYGAYKLFGESSDEHTNDMFTLNYSGSHNNQNQHGGAGYIIRNKGGETVAAGACNLDNLDPKKLNVAITDARALSDGLKFAKEAKLNIDRIQGANDEVIDLVRGSNRKKPSENNFLNGIVPEIVQFFLDQSIDPQNKLEKIDGDRNKVASKLANFASKPEFGEGKKTYYTSFNNLPQDVAKWIQDDKKKS